MATPNGVHAAATLPHLPVNIRKHVRPIAIQLVAVILSTAVLPIALYFLLKYPANAKPSVYLGVATVPFGVGSLISWFTRQYRLTSKKHAENYRPLGATSRWQLDFFQWDFLVSLVVETVVLALSTALDNPLHRLASIGLVFLVANLSIQLVFINVLILAGMRNPFAISSVPKGEPTRTALYTIIEDVIAVDAKQGRNYREIWEQRYLSSPNGMMGKLLLDISWIWGISGICFAAIMAGIIFPRSVLGHDAAFTLGYSLPWIWIGLMALFTFWFVSRRLKMEWAEASRLGMGTSKVGGAGTGPDSV